ncbi:MAG UNVERIFIED_CONTAM: protease modulator HflK [Rickettsiaceae bacterium]|jgi:membrane protease subunit HflK
MRKLFGNSIFTKSPWGDSGKEPEDNIFTKPRKDFRKDLFDDFQFNPNFSPKLIYIILSIFAVFWLGSGIYEVREGEEAVVMRFGKFVRKGTAGLNYRMPAPIEDVIIEKVNQSRRIEIGYRSSVASRHNTVPGREIAAESTMLTGDENIVYLNCDVMWHIKNLEEYVFNVVAPEETVKTAAESAIREEIGQIPITSILSSQKQEIASRIEKSNTKNLRPI